MNKKFSKVLAIALAFIMLLANFGPVFATSSETDSEPKYNTLSPSRGLIISDDQITIVGGERRYYFSGTNTLYGLSVKDNDGNIATIEIRDENGTIVSTRSSDGKVVGAPLGGSSSKYYITLPSEGEYYLVADNLGKYSDKQKNDGEWIKEKLNESSDLEEADLFEKIISFFVLLMGYGLNGLISVIAGENLTIDSILFNKYKNTSLSFFETNNSVIVQNPLLSGGAKQAINFVFNSFRSIALVAYMAILVYMGIRILLISTADKKAKYKQLLFDWIKGVAILFLFPYLMKYAILMNHAFVKYIADNSGIDTGASAMIQSVPGGISAASEAPVGRGERGDYMTDMYFDAVTTYRVTYSICWFIMLIQVIQFLILYLKRLIVTMFLISIFPLVAVSYALDKIADGKSQALNNWTKEFLLNVFVQSFHVINYVILMGLVQGLAGSNFVLTVLAITYISKGGDMIRSLFAQMSGGKGSESNKFLNAAKSYIGAKAVINTVDNFKKVGASIVGKNSLVAKGAARISEGRFKNLQNQAAMENAKTSEFLRDHNLYPKFNADGTRVLNQEQAEKDLGKLLGTIKSSSREFVDAADRLSQLSDTDLKNVMTKMGLTDKDISSLGGVLADATAVSIIAGRHGTNNKVSIQQSTELLIHDRASGNAMIDKYMKGIGYSDERLRKIAASESIAIDDEKIASRRARETAPADYKEEVRRAARSIKNASTGEYSISELNKNFELVKNISKGKALNGQSEDELRQILDEELKGMNYSLKDFEVNLAVQTINNKDSISGDDRRRTISNAMGVIENARYEDRNDTILENLRTDADKLNRTKYVVSDAILERLPNIEKKVNGIVEGTIVEGYVSDKLNRVNRNLKKNEPTITSESKHQDLLIQKDIEREFAENPFAYDRGEEYDTYLKNKAEELQKQAKLDILEGTVQMVTGTVSSTFRAVAGSAGAFVNIGTASGGDKNSAEELVVATTSGFSLAQGPVNYVEQRLSGVAGKIVEKTQKGFDITDSSKITKSMDINASFYEKEATKLEQNRRKGTVEEVRNEKIERIRRNLR